MNNFWLSYKSLLVYVLLWNIICFIVIYNSRKETFQNGFWHKLLGKISEYALSLLGSIGFLPTISMLLNIFLCNEAKGPDLTDSYLDKDCNMFCYTGTHIYYVVIGSFCLFFYLCTAIHCRSYWEHAQPCLHFNTKPSYLSILSIFQIAIALVSKIFKSYSQTILGVLLSAIILILILSNLLLKPYNDVKASVMNLLSLVLAFWSMVLSTIFINIPYNEIWAILNLAGVAAFICIAGFILSKMQSMVARSQGITYQYCFFFNSLASI